MNLAHVERATSSIRHIGKDSCFPLRIQKTFVDYIMMDREEMSFSMQLLHSISLYVVIDRSD